MWPFSKQPKVLRVITTDLEFQRIMEFRYQVYCEELGFLNKANYPNKKESDIYDTKAIHILVQVGKKIGGYTRVILPSAEGLPIFNNFPLEAQNNTISSCEISRFMINKYYRHKKETRREIFRLMAEEIQKVTQEYRIRYVYAVVEEWLLKSLNKRGLKFQKIAEGKDYMGATTYPILLTLS